MNVYDQAHSLARAVVESGEYKEFKALKDEIDKNPELLKMLADFQAKQLEMQAAQLSGGQAGVDPQAVQELYQIIAKDPKAAAYLQAQMRFSLMMNDVFKILGDAMGIGNLGMF